MITNGVGFFVCNLLLDIIILDLLFIASQISGIRLYTLDYTLDYTLIGGPMELLKEVKNHCLGLLLTLGFLFDLPSRHLSFCSSLSGLASAAS